ncbi:MAG: glucose-6-phosphate dehydrogenase [Candidatus Bathyarchaeota archaeon]|nr:glucose-6-phosphate dehydrogenase [Candidatus Bathyarchaeota archaeon]
MNESQSNVRFRVEPEEQVAREIPTVLVIFGATGDLMAKKVLPALFHLFQKNKLPTFFRAIGVGRRNLTDETFRNHIAEALKEHKDLDSEKVRLEVESFLGFFFYHRGSIWNLDDYKKLARTLGRVDDKWQTCSNKLFYLGIPPSLYEPALRNLAESGLTRPCSDEEGWTRVIVEKPFGNDLESAGGLCEILNGLFKEEQVYLIDHYLGKEMIQNILVFRFANILFEGFWNNRFIESITIKLLESIGVEDRGEFYDSVGALRDVGQNHLLQMLALITMENPRKFESTLIQRGRAEILEKLKTLREDEIRNLTFRAQYNSYRGVKGVRPDSTTETYFKVAAFLDSARWRGVPIVLESGKRLKTRRKEIVVHFKHPAPCLCPPRLEPHYKNRVVFSLEPKEAIELHLQSKEPGFRMLVGDNPFKCVFQDERKAARYVEEYEKLLFDCIVGDQTFFLSTEEIEASWKFIDPIISSWRKGLVPLNLYEPDENQILSESKVVEQPLSKKTGIKKEIGVVGLGKMGSNLALNLIDKGWRVVGFNRTYAVTRKLERKGIVGSASLKELAAYLEPPRVIWLMIKAGKPVDEVLFSGDGLVNYLDKGDIVVDGGNSFYKDSVRRAEELEKKGIFFVDAGVSGGPEGARYGACLMVGGKRAIYEKIQPLFLDISAPQGVKFFEGVGAGHFVKMVHNGIEYGIMQSIAEGFAILKNAEYFLDLKDAADVYNHGSVIESRLVGWLKRAFEVHGVELENISGAVAHTGEGEWTVRTAHELEVKAKIIEESLKFRVQSEKNPSYTGKILSALREQFGGHAATIT